MTTYRKKYNLPDGGKFFCLYCQDTYELRRELCSHFSDIIVLEPKRLVLEIKTEVSKMKSLYDNI